MTFDPRARETSTGMLVESLAIIAAIETGLKRSLAAMAPWRLGGKSEMAPLEVTRTPWR